VFSTTTTGPGPVTLINNAQFGLYYTVVHKVITECGELCYAQEQFQQEGRGADGGNGYTRAVEIDCCFVFDFWPNGPGEPIPFTAQFDIGLDLSGNIITGNFFEYENEPSTVHEWLLFTSPNPSGGPYTLIDQQTGTDYTYGPIDDEIYYFLVHRVITDCGEVCYGQSICRNCDPLKGACELCMEFDCSILDDIIPDCETLPAPTNLMVDGDTLTWDPVPGAVSYIVSSPGGTDPQIACPCELPVSIIPITTNTNSLVLPEGLQRQCFIWMVTAVCHDGTTSDPSNQECFMPIRRSSENSSEISQIAPNPNNGNMNFVVQTSYDSEVTVEVHDFYGKLIQTFVTSLEAHTPSTISWDAAGQLARGIYFVTFKTDQNTWSKKVIVD
ncbi:MAG: T9SS type A sorting domain-containing protein, partial [Bacteroidota bacterium]